MKPSIFLLAIGSLLLASCASIQSIENPEARSADGLTYFMPKKNISVTITVNAAKEISKVEIGTTPSFPDTSKRYVLEHGGNAFGKNTLDVGVSTNGLLKSTKSTTISSVNDTFKNLATSFGTIETFGILNAGIQAESECSKEGKHTFVFEVDSSGESACGLPVNITKLGAGSTGTEHTKRENEKVSGIYYRQNQPYEVTVIGAGIVSSSIVFSPSQSNTYFLPVSKTFFANNLADFELKDGIPTKYKQETESELLALFKLPADVIGAYFLAVGKVFENFSSNDKKETAALTESLNLELAKIKYEACLAAINAEEEEKIEELGCK